MLKRMLNQKNELTESDDRQTEKTQKIRMFQQMARIVFLAKIRE